MDSKGRKFNQSQPAILRHMCAMGCSHPSGTAHQNITPVHSQPESPKAPGTSQRSRWETRLWALGRFELETVQRWILEQASKTLGSFCQWPPASNHAAFVSSRAARIAFEDYKGGKSDMTNTADWKRPTILAARNPTQRHNNFSASMKIFDATYTFTQDLREDICVGSSNKTSVRRCLHRTLRKTAAKIKMQ
jgi:hypothetical protein